MSNLLMLPGGKRWAFEYWRIDWKKRPSGDKERIEDWLWERDWAMIEAFDNGLSPAQVADHFGITVGRLRMIASRVQWRSAAHRIDYVDDPQMMKSMQDDIATLDRIFGWESVHEHIDPLRGIHLRHYYESGRQWLPRPVAKKLLPYLRFYNKDAQERLQRLAQGRK